LPLALRSYNIFGSKNNHLLSMLIRIILVLNTVPFSASINWSRSLVFICVLINLNGLLCCWIVIWLRRSWILYASSFIINILNWYIRLLMQINLHICLTFSSYGTSTSSFKLLSTLYLLHAFLCNNHCPLIHDTRLASSLTQWLTSQCIRMLLAQLEFPQIE
jgi:hypothetical protein